MTSSALSSYSIVVGSWFVEIQAKKPINQSDYEILSAVSLKPGAPINEINDQSLTEAINEQIVQDNDRI